MSSRSVFVGWITSRLVRLRFPRLFLLTAALFGLDLLLPDVIPFADEILLALATALLGSLKNRRAPAPS
jgi:hypothetical protein